MSEKQLSLSPLCPLSRSPCVSAGAGWVRRFLFLAPAARERAPPLSHLGARARGRRLHRRPAPPRASIGHAVACPAPRAIGTWAVGAAEARVGGRKEGQKSGDARDSPPPIPSPPRAHRAPSPRCRAGGGRTHTRPRHRARGAHGGRRGGARAPSPSPPARRAGAIPGGAGSPTARPSAPPRHRASRRRSRVRAVRGGRGGTREAGRGGGVGGQRAKTIGAAITRLPSHQHSLSRRAGAAVFGHGEGVCVGGGLEVGVGVREERSSGNSRTRVIKKHSCRVVLSLDAGAEKPHTRQRCTPARPRA